MESLNLQRRILIPFDPACKPSWLRTEKKKQQQRPVIQLVQQLGCREIVPDAMARTAGFAIKVPSALQVFFPHQVASSLSPPYTPFTSKPLIIMKTNTLFTLTFVVGLLVSSSVAAPIATKRRVSKRDEVPAGCPGTLRGPTGNSYFGRFNGRALSFLNV